MQCGNRFDPLCNARNVRRLSMTSSPMIAPHTADLDVLIIEDNPLNIKLFARLLESEGFTTRTATSGEDGLRQAREHPPGVILLDINLPDISGIEVNQKLKADPTLARVPVVAVTAFTSNAYEEMRDAGGCDAFLTKPISIATFLMTMRAVAGRVEVL